MACLFIVISRRKYSQMYNKNTDNPVYIIAYSTRVPIQFRFPNYIIDPLNILYDCAFKYM